MSKFCLLFIVVSLYWALVSVGYTIDDSNYSVLKFSENPAGPKWGPFGSDTGEVLEIRLPNGTTQTVDATQCFDGTYTYAACSASNNCEVQFPFTGSGITIYVLRAGPQGMSASLSIDSGAPMTATLDVPPAPQYYIPRVPLLSVQNLVSGTHTAVMQVLDWNGGFSGMMLDYIDVNQAQVSGPSPSPNPSPNPSPSPTSNAAQPQSSTPASQASRDPQTSQQASSTGTQANSASVTSVAILSVLSSPSSGATALPSGMPSGNGTSSTASSSSGARKTNVAAVAGGVIGGAVGLIALLALGFLCFRRRRRLQALNDRPSPLLLPQSEARFTDIGIVGGDPFASSVALATSGPSRTSRPLQSWTESEGSTANLMALDASNSSASPATNFSHSRVASSGSDNATLSVPVSIGAGAAVATIAQDRNTSASARPVQPVARSASAAAPASYPSEKAGSAPSSSQQQGQTASPLEAPDTRPNPVLTDDQADFVNSLFNNNVPAPVIARVLERMLANPQGASGTGYNDPELRPLLNPGDSFAPWRPPMSDIGDGETIGTAPPSYDYVQAQ